MKVKALIVFGLAIASGGLLLYTSQAVQEAETKLRNAQRQLKAEQQKMRVLKAEWAFLSAPERLEKVMHKAGKAQLGDSKGQPRIVDTLSTATNSQDPALIGASYKNQGAQ